MSKAIPPGGPAVERTVAFFTATRAEYGLLRPLMREVAERPSLRRQVIVSGTHLSARHGETWRELAADGIAIDARCDLGLNDAGQNDSDEPLSVAHAAARCLQGVAEALTSLRPHLLVILGDRYEALAAAQAALLCGVPVAHLCGGELTEGAFDDQLRHALTKLASLHFVAAEPYRRRVLQLGEPPERVHCVGAPAVDNFAAMPALSPAQLASELGFDPGERFLLVTFHPETTDRLPAAEAVEQLLRALDRHGERRVVLTEPNADPGSVALVERLRRWAAGQPGRVLCVPSLGSRRYVAALRLCGAVVGNSSSGVVEGPLAGVPTVNLGDRQAGRLRAASVIDCPVEETAIVAALDRALTPAFQQLSRAVASPYGAPGVATRIADVLEAAPLQGLLRKRFVDV